MAFIIVLIFMIVFISYFKLIKKDMSARSILETWKTDNKIFKKIKLPILIIVSLSLLSINILFGIVIISSIAGFFYLNSKKVNHRKSSLTFQDITVNFYHIFVDYNFTNDGTHNPILNKVSVSSIYDEARNHGVLSVEENDEDNNYFSEEETVENIHNLIEDAYRYLYDTQWRNMSSNTSPMYINMHNHFKKHLSYIEDIFDYFILNEIPDEKIVLISPDTVTGPGVYETLLSTEMVLALQKEYFK